MKSKPRLNFWQLWNMSFGYFGIQFGFQLQNVNVSRIFQSLGADIGTIPILWIAGPVTGLLIHPIVGYLSDKTWNGLGRRKPYFLLGAVLSSLALFFMPNSPALWIAAGMLWLMDGSINTSMQPFRAFIGDMLPQDQQTKGFAVQTFFIGIASVIASSLPYAFANWFGISNIAPEGQIADSVKWSFYIGGIVFLLAVLWTVFKTKEYSPEEMNSFQDENSEDDTSAKEELIINKHSYNTQGLMLMAGGVALAVLEAILHIYIGLYILAAVILVYGLLQIVTARLNARGNNNGVVEIIYNIKNMPPVMKKLAWVQMLTWFALFAFFIYSVPAICDYHYGSRNTGTEIYNKGANWGGILHGLYNGVAALVVFLIPMITRKFGRPLTHAICLAIGGLGLISMFLFKNPDLLVISMIALGIAWASLLTIPYAILAGSLPQKKMGIYMGTFNLFIVIPQIVATAILGLMVRDLFNNQSIYALVLGGVAMILAGVLMMFVKDNYEKA